MKVNGNNKVFNILNESQFGRFIISIQEFHTMAHEPEKYAMAFPEISLTRKDIDYALRMLLRGMHLLAESVMKSLTEIYGNSPDGIHDKRSAEEFLYNSTNPRFNAAGNALVYIYTIIEEKRTNNPNWIQADFQRLIMKVNHYRIIAQQHAQDHEIESITKAFVGAYKHEKSKAGHSDQGAKKPTGYKEAIRQHNADGYIDYNALWQHFMTKHKNEGTAFQVGEYSIYWNQSDTYEEGCLIQECNGRKKSITKGRFKNIFYEVRKE